MLGEKAFRKVIARKPEDWHTLRVYGEWLEDRDDPRGRGWQALGVRKMTLWKTWERVPGEYWWWDWSRSVGWGPGSHPADPLLGFEHPAELPGDWFAKVAKKTHPHWPVKVYPYRMAAFDAAALAFGRLPAARQEELLAQGLRC